MTRKQKRRVKQPFWKKWDPTIKAAGRSFKKIFESGHGMDYTAAAGCAFLGGAFGYKMSPAKIPEKILGVGAGAISGVIAYQLCKSMNLASGSAGVSILAGMGIVSSPWFPTGPQIAAWIEQSKGMMFPWLK